MQSDDAKPTWHHFQKSSRDDWQNIDIAALRNGDIKVKKEKIDKYQLLKIVPEKLWGIKIMKTQW